MIDHIFNTFKEQALEVLEVEWCSPIDDYDDLIHIFEECTDLEDLKNKLSDGRICYCPSILEALSKDFEDYNSDQCCYMYENNDRCESNKCWIEGLDRHFNK